MSDQGTEIKIDHAQDNLKTFVSKSAESVEKSAKIAGVADILSPESPYAQISFYHGAKIQPDLTALVVAWRYRPNEVKDMENYTHQKLDQVPEKYRDDLLGLLRVGMSDGVADAEARTYIQLQSFIGRSDEFVSELDIDDATKLRLITELNRHAIGAAMSHQQLHKEE